MKRERPDQEYGNWTLRTRLVCLLRGHVAAPEPFHTGKDIVAYRCVRCGDYAMYRDAQTGAWFLTFDDWFDNLSLERIATRLAEPLFGDVLRGGSAVSEAATDTPKDSLSGQASQGERA